MLPPQPPRFNTAQRDAYDLWLRIVGTNRVETVERFLDAAQADASANGQPFDRYKLSRSVFALIAKGALVSINPNDQPVARLYHLVSPPPWGPRRPGARRVQP